ncbi:Opioid growth factor receptor, partial [Frankliniella fusca]
SCAPASSGLQRIYQFQLQLSPPSAPVQLQPAQSSSVAPSPEVSGPTRSQPSQAPQLSSPRQPSAVTQAQF